MTLFWKSHYIQLLDVLCFIISLRAWSELNTFGIADALTFGALDFLKLSFNIYFLINWLLNIVFP